MDVPVKWWRGLKWTFVTVGFALAISLAATAAVYLVQKGNDEDQTAARLVSDERLNRMVCVTRPYIRSAIARADFTAEHGTDAAKRETARQAGKSNRVFLKGLVTIPVDFDCVPLIAKIRKEALHG